MSVDNTIYGLSTNPIVNSDNSSINDRALDEMDLVAQEFVETGFSVQYRDSSHPNAGYLALPKKDFDHFGQFEITTAGGMVNIKISSGIFGHSVARDVYAAAKVSGRITL